MHQALECPMKRWRVRRVPWTGKAGSNAYVLARAKSAKFYMHVLCQYDRMCIFLFQRMPLYKSMELGRHLCMYVYIYIPTEHMYIYIYVYVYMYIYIYMHMYWYLYMHIEIYAERYIWQWCVYVSTSMCVQKLSGISKDPRIHTFMHANIHTCIHAYMHTYMHASMHTCMHACTQKVSRAPLHVVKPIVRKRAQV